MSYGPLPKRIDPRKLAEREVRFESVVQVKDLPNLVDCLASSEGELNVDLQFGKDERHLRTIVGSAKGSVHMACQRCLEAVEVDVEATFNLAIALTEEQAKQQPRHYDPLIIEEEEIELFPVLEEELILSLPMVPYHLDCSVKTSFGDLEEAVQSDDVGNTSGKTNPFSVLAQLKANKT